MFNKKFAVALLMVLVGGSLLALAGGAKTQAQGLPTPTPTADCPQGVGLLASTGRVVGYIKEVLDGTTKLVGGVEVEVEDALGRIIAGDVSDGRGRYVTPYFDTATCTPCIARVIAPEGYEPVPPYDQYELRPRDFDACHTAYREFRIRKEATPTPTNTPTSTPTSTPTFTPTPTTTPTATASPTPTSTPTVTRTPRPTPTPGPCPPSRVQLPILSFVGDEKAEPWIEVQNVGTTFTKAALVLWGESSSQCPPNDPGPLSVLCTGLLYPGSAEKFIDQIPRGAKSAIVYSFPPDVADEICYALHEQVVGHSGEWRRFDKAYQEGGVWDEYDFGAHPGQPLAVEVNRTGVGDDSPVFVSAAYSGISQEMEGIYDPIFGGYAYYAPLIYAIHPKPPRDFTSWLYIQNSGRECTSVEVWFQKQDDCLRARICDTLALAPGETWQLDASTCVGPSFQGSAWIRSSQPLGIVVDQVGRDVLMAYQGKPVEISYAEEPEAHPGSQVAYGPLIYREYNGWDTGIQVQNLSSVYNAKVKVTFLDEGGDIITSVVDWVCPRGSQSYYLPVINNLPGNYVGAVRVESQEWWTPGDPKVHPPNIVAIAQLVKYEGPARAVTLEAIAYNLFTEGEANLAVPSLLKRSRGVISEIAIQNVNLNPGDTNLAIYIYDQNGPIDYVCQMLNHKQVEYINLDVWGNINNGFAGSVVIEATGSDQAGGPRLAVVAVERVGTSQGFDIPGDESKGYAAFPLRCSFAPPGGHCP